MVVDGTAGMGHLWCPLPITQNIFPRHANTSDYKIAIVEVDVQYSFAEDILFYGEIPVPQQPLVFGPCATWTVI